MNFHFGFQVGRFAFFTFENVVLEAACRTLKVSRFRSLQAGIIVGGPVDTLSRGPKA